MVDNSNTQNKQQQQKKLFTQLSSDKNKFLQPENMTILNQKTSISSLSNKNLSNNTSPTSFSWSSNVSMKSLLLDVEPNYGRRRTINVTDTDEEKTVCSGKSNFFLTKSNENLRIQEQTDRPLTARSLPAKVENEENKILYNQAAISQSNKLTLTGSNSKNSSCPLLSSSQVKLIQVTSSEDNEKKSVDFTFEDDCNESSPKHVTVKKVENKLANRNNLDKYLDYTLSPFTTKFEIIGNSRLMYYNNKRFGHEPKSIYISIII